MMEAKQLPRSDRRGAIIVLSAILMIVMFCMAALAIDMGYMFVVRTQLQAAADAGALAAGNSMHLAPNEIRQKGIDYVTRHEAGGRQIRADETTVELGIWDADTESFRAIGAGRVGNAVRVTARRNDEALFFARVMGTKNFTTEASAISMANPRDIVFVIDSSGSMNDDTEPAWATATVNAEFSGAGFGSIGTQLMTDVYQDFGFGAFPGRLQYLGEPLGVARGDMAYGDMTSDIGPLSSGTIPGRYRIAPGDDESTRREKAYRWIIDNQLAAVIPDARPRPNSSNYGYWEKYIDYVLQGSRIVAPSPPKPPSDGDDDDDDDDGGGGSPPKPPTKPKPPSKPKPPKPKPPKPPIGYVPSAEVFASWHDTPAGALAMLGSQNALMRPAYQWLLTAQMYGPAASGPGLPRVGGLYGKNKAWVPPSQDGDRIDRFNNPNKLTFPSADSSLPKQLRNFFGYLTYTQFLMDHGRDLRPDKKTYVELSLNSGRCPRRADTVAGRSFDFPPRTQPMHAARRSIISAIDIVDERNDLIPGSGNRDHVSIVSYDTTDGSQIRQNLTHRYVRAMRSVTRLQATGDKGTTTATETGLALAHEILRPRSEGGQAREDSTKIVVLLTDGVPNAFESSAGAIDAFALSNPSGDFYGGGYYWLDAALMKTMQLQADRIDVFPVGVGLGADYDFMDRAARAGGTADSAGRSPRGSGNPAEYEDRMIEIFERIIKQPVAKLVM
ncbi:MAG: pilus assembly protein TadG-related protein [Planctomycetota bacterium]